MGNPNRFEPPRVAVADIVAPDRHLAARPRSVVWALALLAASIVVSLVAGLPMIDPPMADEPAAMTAMAWAITLALLALELWFMRCVWLRRDWARWVMVALIALGVAVTAFTFEDELARAPLVAGLAALSTLASAAAGVLLLLPASARWFRPR